VIVLSKLKNPRIALGAIVAAGALVSVTGCDAQGGADTAKGQALFTQKCGSCHALTAAGTSANIGPNLDNAFKQARADGMDSATIEGVVQTQIEAPRQADPRQTNVYMPANLVEGQEAEDVASYVASVAGVPGLKPAVFMASDYFATNCGSCHTLQAAGTTGQVGPALDTALQGQSAAMISDSIKNPNATIAPGFPANVMPASFGQSLTPEQLAALVKYLQDSIQGK